jgi:cysteinyl-tRNA synthetase
MSLRVYNTLTREKEIFQPIVSGKVGIYLCGPTVYKPPHLGHMVGPVIFDAIKRYLLYKGYEVTWVINITDVEDKLIETSLKTGLSVEALAEKYTAEYLECLQRLGVDSVDRFPKATDHIADIIQLCATLIDKGCAYAADGNVYFDVTQDKDYGKLSKRKVEESEAGLRAVEAAGKRNPADFALWKAANPARAGEAGKAGEPTWESPWGPGRPGWHIECSAMSMKYLGETFDMHGGGLDLMFPHHENELAQSECATGKPFAQFWMHNGLTRIKTKLASGEWADEKMSGSLGNVVSAKELIDQYGADLLRYMLLSTHYRRPIEFTDEVMANAKKGLAVFHRLFERCERLAGKAMESGGPDMNQASVGLMETDLAGFARNTLAYKMKFLEMMDDDFNTAGGIAVMHELAGEVNGFIERFSLERDKQPQRVDAAFAAAMTLRNVGALLGLFRQKVAPPVPETGLTEQLMQLLIGLRQQARQDKNFALADAIRKGLSDIGVTLEDRADQTVWRKE